LSLAAALPWTTALMLSSPVNGVAQESKLALTTSAFEPGGMIPKQFTCSGADNSPALSWNDPPPSTQSFALILDDPDAPMGTFVHWVVYNVPASVRQLPQGVKKGETLAGGGKQGQNDFPKTGYGGPCPPPGTPHRYFFRLYALDTILNLKPPVHRDDVDQAMRGHVLAKAELMGKFGR
jgi:Raf kinase inhibitor-like YbhB/YbcL family protein